MQPTGVGGHCRPAPGPRDVDHVPGTAVEDLGSEEQLVDLPGGDSVKLAEHQGGMPRISASCGPASGRTARTSVNASDGRYKVSPVVFAVANQATAESRPRTSAASAEASRTFPPITPQRRRDADGGFPRLRARGPRTVRRPADSPRSWAHRTGPPSAPRSPARVHRHWRRAAPVTAAHRHQRQSDAVSRAPR
jgi:hypothetical protein